MAKLALVLAPALNICWIRQDSTALLGKFCGYPTCLLFATWSISSRPPSVIRLNCLSRVASEPLDFCPGAPGV